LYSPSPSEHLSAHRLQTAIFNPRAATTIALALLFLALNLTSTQAQTRARRARPESDKSSVRDNDKNRTAAKRGADDKRVARSAEDKKRQDANDRKLFEARKRVEDSKRPGTAVARRATPPPVEIARREAPRQVVTNPLVRKTALTYAPNTPIQPAIKRPVLVNDITVVSRVGETPAPTTRLTSATRAVSSASANIPAIWPVIGPLRSGVGMRSNPFGGSSIEYHKGQDIAAPIGTPVIATADGIVTVAGWQRGYGWVVYIDHGNGLSTRYGHLSRIDVTVGQNLKRGEQLGLVGSTGRSTGPHLHYEVRVNGQPVSPLLYLPTLPVPATAKREGETNISAQR
jgi:murein DD-endopeptidase MepM/ murein hydrolase activator NlpD